MELLRQEAANLSSGSKDLYSLGKELGLNREQIAFAEAYVSPDNLGSNGRAAAADAYGYDLDDRFGKQNASNAANRNLKHPQINLLIAILLDTAGFNNEYVDKQLMMLIEQNADPKTKIMAISEYNKVQNRFKTTIEHITNPLLDPSVYTADQLEQLRSLLLLGKIQYEQAKHLPILP
jgi:hypothetical protein